MGDSNIIISQTGTYLITYKVNPQAGTSAFGLFNGDNLISGSSYGSVSGDQTYSGKVIVALAASNVLSLRNLDGSTTFRNEIPSDVDVNSASIVIQRLA